ncbi:response regulator [Roseateles asaccharophilus]|uniref:DNA-binding response OmpR family regulator n=1 Tax=Roseateles asaccharophilus TaxID=582607 RepID=A0ABU2A9C6_9BURK|nr:response regulator [Roseateles asaccharophilus]MDR7333803.1 DNA-binding response OmpR family regulator [Roseateles asaccharophilus]
MATTEDFRVVLVDDDVDTCETLSELLKFDGYSVRVATTAQDAIQAVNEYQPVCALLDLGLPDFDGCELSKRLRAAHGSDIVLIAVTGRSGDDEHNQALAAGVDHVLCKPLTVENLRRFFPPLN